eukprot:gene9588-12914_t
MKPRIGRAGARDSVNNSNYGNNNTNTGNINYEDNRSNNGYNGNFRGSSPTNDYNRENNMYNLNNNKNINHSYSPVYENNNGYYQNNPTTSSSMQSPNSGMNGMYKPRNERMDNQSPTPIYNNQSNNLNAEDESYEAYLERMNHPTNVGAPVTTYNDNVYVNQNRNLNNSNYQIPSSSPNRNLPSNDNRDISTATKNIKSRQVVRATVAQSRWKADARDHYDHDGHISDEPQNQNNLSPKTPSTNNYNSNNLMNNNTTPLYDNNKNYSNTNNLNINNTRSSTSSTVTSPSYNNNNTINNSNNYNDNNNNYLKTFSPPRNINNSFENNTKVISNNSSPATVPVPLLNNSQINDMKRNQPSQQPVFDRSSLVQLCVDGASKLPWNAVATRVSALILTWDRVQVCEAALPAFSFPDSACQSPTYDLHMSWRGAVLDPSLTIVFRVDTLEKPSLKPKCMGYAAIKLCKYANGDQPKPGQQKQTCYLNAGNHDVPIFYGRVPLNGPLVEESMNDLPKIPNAILKVRLFDPNIEQLSTSINSNRSDITSPTTNSKLDSRHLSDSSIGLTIVKLYTQDMQKVARLPVSKSLMDEITRGHSLDSNELKIFYRQITDWMTNIFPPIKEMRLLLDYRYMLPYNDEEGAMIGLDMLYNMPIRKTLIHAASASLSRNSMIRKWNNKLTYFKTVFRYLPGSTTRKGAETKSSSPSRTESADPDYAAPIHNLIVDDASININFDSKELCPHFVDEFSVTSHLELTPNSCLLIVVTAVDVLTTNETQKSRGNNNRRNGQQQSMRRDRVSPDDYDGSNGLDGLVGVFVGNRDPLCTWWGVIPLQISNNNNATANATNEAQGGKSSAFVSPRKGMVSESGISSSFVNAGTHQVPLFEGLPPEDLFKVGNAMNWVIRKIKTQQLLVRSMPKSVLSYIRNPMICCGQHGVDDVLNDVGNSIQDYISLSPGASAIVRIVDARLGQFGGKHILEDSDSAVNEEWLITILKTISTFPVVNSNYQNFDSHRYKLLYAAFNYLHLKNTHMRSIRDALPPNLDPIALIKEINEKFIESLSK